MAGTFIDELAFNTSVDSEGVREGLSQVEGMFKKTLNSILNNFVAPLSGALAVGRLFGNYTQQADKVAKFSRSLNINAEELQVWGEAAALAGGSAQAFQNSVRMLQRRISMSGDSAGKGGDMFKKLGIDIKDASGKTKDAFQIMSELAAKADTMDKVEFAGMAQRLRIDQGTIQLLQQGSEGVKKLVDEMREYGVITAEDSAAAEDYNDAMEKFRRSTSVAAAKVFSVLLPPISEMITLFAKCIAFLTKHRELLRGAGFAAMGVAIGTKLIPMLTKLKGAMSLKTLGEWGKLAALFTTLYLIIQDFVVWLQGGKVAFAGFWEQFGTAEEVKKKLSDLKDTVVSVIGWFAKFSPGIKVAAAALMLIGSGLGAILAYQKVVTFIQSLGKAMAFLDAAMAANPVGAAIAGIILAIIVLVSYWDELKAAALACWNFLTDLWNGFADWFLGIFNGTEGGLKNWWNGIANWILGLFGGVCEGLKNLWNWDDIFAAAQVCVDYLTKLWNGFADWILGLFGGVGEGLKNWWNGIIDFFLGGWKSMLDGLLDFLPDKMKNWFLGGSDKSKTEETPQKYDLPAISVKSKTDETSKEDDLTKVLSTTPYYSPAVTTALEANPQPIGNITTDNSKEIHIQTVNIKTDKDNINGIANSVEAAADGRMNTGYTMSSVADDVAQGQHG